MQLNAFIKNLIITVICYLYVLLFVYAAVSKFLDFENFQVQLAQSPLLSAYAGWVSWGVIIIELIISLLLIFRSTRLIGLYSAYSLMIMFIVYIFIILYYSEFIPCSCGGILEELNWIEHLIFNLFFVFLSFIGILLMIQTESRDFKLSLYIQIIITFCSIILVIALYLSSEDVVKHKNNFIRRFHQHPFIEQKEYDLKANSYYFAGTSNDKIYLGNYTAPLILTEIDTTFTENKTTKIKLDNQNHSFSSIMIKVRDSSYYIYDGSVPVIYRGKLNSQTAQTLSYNDVYFSQIEVIDSNSFAIRTLSSLNNKLILATLNTTRATKVNLSFDIIETHLDDVFTSDGKLIQDNTTNQFIYIYYYKNQYIIMDKELNVLNRLNTIDTISKPQIKSKSMNNGKHKLNAPPLLVNKNAAAHKNILFNESNLIGKYESSDLWKNSAIVDIYKTDKQNYLGSIFVQNRGINKMAQMMLTDKYLFVLSGNEIIRYRLAQSITKNFKKGEAEYP